MAIGKETRSLIALARRNIKSPELSGAFQYGLEHEPDANLFIQGLHEIVIGINELQPEFVKPDMPATLGLVKIRLATSKSFSSPLSQDDFNDRKNNQTFIESLKVANELIGPHFKYPFETYSSDPIEDARLKLGASIIDGYAVFSLIDFDISEIKQGSFMDQLANAICEVAAELKDTFLGARSLYEMAEKTGWYTSSWGITKEFLARHKLKDASETV